ncbi:MAG: FAD-dependent monooxygenase [Pseudonocardiaceae bacterium]
MTNAATALVIGGGIAGPVTAMALQRVGIRATMYEAYDRPADGAGGAMMIGLNALNALRTLGLDDTVRDIGIPTRRVIVDSWTGKRVTELRTPRDQLDNQVVARTDLYRALYDKTANRGIRIEHGKRLVGAEDTDDGVTAHFADGTTASADILIGADGIHSTVRSLIDPHAPQPSYLGLLSFIGVVDDPGLIVDHAVHLVYGKRAYYGYRVNEDRPTLWYCDMPAAEPLTAAQMREVPAEEWLRRLRELVAGDNTPASDILRQADPDKLVIAGPSEYLPNVPTWHRGRMVLVGDSAHAPSSSSGQGASMSIESATQLARCLRDLPMVSDAFTGYEALRRPRLRRVIARGERNKSRKTVSGLRRVLRDLLLPVVMKLTFTPEKMAWLFEYQIDWGAPVRSATASGAAGP